MVRAVSLGVLKLVGDAELIEGVRRRAGEPALAVRVRRRSPLGGDAGGSGAHFEGVALDIDGARCLAVLKVNAPDAYSPSFERRFYQEVSSEVAVRVPRLLASGDLAGSPDGWLLLERLPARKQRSAWTSRDVRACVREIARLHARTLGRAPGWLPQPLTRDLPRYLSHVPEGVARLRALQARWPAFAWFASPRAAELAVQLASQPQRLVAALARSPQCLIHRDFHPGNVAVPRAGDPIVFDWEGAAAGPPIFDVTLFFQYLGLVWTTVPWLGIELSRLERPAVSWEDLLAAYLDALETEAAELLDTDAVRDAASAAFVWEAVYRLGWVEHQLHEIAPHMARARSSGPAAAWARRKVDLNGLRARSLLFDDLERRGPEFLV